MRKHIPNAITVSRIILLPYFLVSLWRSLIYPELNPVSWPVMLFAVMVFTDWLDGYLARRFKWQTDIGKWLDPLADKIVDFAAWMTLLAFLFDRSGVGKMTAGAMLSYWFFYFSLAWMVTYRLGQDIYSQRSYKRHGGQSNIFGKVKFNFDMLGIALGILGIHLAQSRGLTFHSAMIIMISSLGLAATCAYASTEIKEGRRALPGKGVSDPSANALVDTIIHTPLPSFDRNSEGTPYP